MLAQPGVLLMAGDAEKADLVVSTSRYGCLTYEVILKRTSWGLMFLKFVQPAGGPRIVRIENYDGWKVLSVDPVAPGSPQNDRNLMLPGIAVAAGSVQAPLLTHAAKCGLRGLTVEILRKLFNDLCVPYEAGRKPCSEAALVKALVAHILPEATEHEIAAAIAEREDEPPH